MIRKENGSHILYKEKNETSALSKYIERHKAVLLYNVILFYTYYVNAAVISLY